MGRWYMCICPCTASCPCDPSNVARPDPFRGEMGQCSTSNGSLIETCAWHTPAGLQPRLDECSNATSKNCMPLVTCGAQTELLGSWPPHPCTIQRKGTRRGVIEDRTRTACKSRTAASVHIVARARGAVLRNSQRSHRKDRDRSKEKHGCRGVRASRRASSTKLAVCMCVQVRWGFGAKSLISLKVWRKQTLGRVTVQLQ